jgi:hypothetical protein
MKDNYYTDVVLGNWVHDKKSSNKENLCYKRSAKVTLHKDYAMDWLDSKTYKKYKVYGEVVLNETKLIDIKTSNQSFFRGLELTDTSVKDLVI